MIDAWLRYASLSQEALRGLDRFTVDESSCFSDVDRAALTSVICEWFTDRSVRAPRATPPPQRARAPPRQPGVARRAFSQAGEVDPRRLAEIGKHKFESLVRHTLAPSIARQQEANMAWMCFLVFGTAFQGIALAQVCPAICTLHLAPCTRHFAPCIVHPALGTLHPARLCRSSRSRMSFAHPLTKRAV